MRVARKVELSSEDRAVLEQQARGRSLPARLVERSRIVLRAADGLQDREIAAEFGITRKKLLAGEIVSLTAAKRLSLRMLHARDALVR